jgi:hypothetical protein
VTLLAAYNFDEASGTILDRSGNGRDVAFAGSLTRVAGHTSSGLSQSTTAADSPGPALTGMQTAAYTIMGWVTRSTNSVDGWLLEFKQGGSGDRGALLTGGNVQSRCKNVAGTVFTVQAAQPAAGTPWHFACTNDGTTLRLFINGTEVGTGTAFSGGVRTNSTSSSFLDTLGSETVLDDARYYDTALTAATITTLMGTPVTSGGGGNSQAISPALESDTPVTPVRARAQAVTSAAELDVAVTPAKGRPILPAVELDQGITPVRARSQSPAPALELDQAIPPAPAGHVQTITPAVELDQAITPLNPNAVVRDLDWAASVDAGLWSATIDPDTWTAGVEPGRWFAEVDA